MTNKSRLRAWSPAVLLAAAIFAASSTRGSSLPGRWPRGTDKVAHTLVYAALGALVARARGLRAGGVLSRRDLGISMAFTIAYGVTDEIHQRFVPGRRFELADLAADALGALVGVTLMAWRMRRPSSLPAQPPP